MSSTNKTTHLRLNNWIGADKPLREDFNRDNSILDEAIYSHRTDESIHITEQERAAWNEPYYISSYLGDGTSSRVVAMNCGFVPRFGIIFAVNSPPGVNDYRNSAHYNYFALVTQNGSSVGVTMNAKNLTVTQSAVPVSVSEYKSFNEVGTTYIYVVFR